MNRFAALWQTTVGKKVVMATTGLIMVLFLISHMISNVLIFSSPEHLDRYAAWLRSLGPLLWAVRIILLVSLLLHIWAAWQLTRRAHGARPDRYARHERLVTTYAARTMRWGGVLLAVFIVFHILNLTTGTIHPDFRPGMVGHNVVTDMAVTPIAVFYLLAMLALGLHFWHGVWSVFQTLGVTNPAWNRARRVIAIGLAVIVAGGFASIPLAALFGWLR